MPEMKFCTNDYFVSGGNFLVDAGLGWESVDFHAAHRVFCEMREYKI